MELEDIFGFVNKKYLREHLASALICAVELTTLAKSYPEPTRSVFYKTSIVYLASIIEASLHYGVQKLGYTHYKSEWLYKEIKVLDKKEDAPDEEVIGGKRIKKDIPLVGYVDFAVLNRFCRDKAKFYAEEIYKKVDRVRKLRNEIHLMGISEVNKKYSKSDVDKVAEMTNDILDIIEDKLRQ
jgi:CRISPR/Cas system Type II protein with McrA/HNH and RuvC-like nuclease domain